MQFIELKQTTIKESNIYDPRLLGFIALIVHMNIYISKFSDQKIFAAPHEYHQ